MTHHAAQIEKEEDEGNIKPRIGDEEHRNNSATALNNRFRPVAFIGIQELRIRFRMMDGMDGIDGTPVQNSVRHIEPDIVAKDREKNGQHF